VQGSLEPSLPPAAGPEAEAKPPWRRLLFLGIVLLALLALVYLTPLRAYLSRVREVSDSVRGLGALAPVVWTFGVAVLVAIGFPRLLLCVIAGMALGFWWGLLWTQLGTLLGNYAVFLVARKNSQGWAERYLSHRARLHNIIKQEGLAGVILARQVPLPGLVINLACGLVSLRHRDFLLGTIIGQLPQAVPFTMIGAGALQTSFSHSVKLIGAGVALAVIVWLTLRAALRRRRGAP